MIYAIVQDAFNKHMEHYIDCMFKNLEKVEKEAFRMFNNSNKVLEETDIMLSRIKRWKMNLPDNVILDYMRDRKAAKEARIHVSEQEAALKEGLGRGRSLLKFRESEKDKGLKIMKRSSKLTALGKGSVVYLSCRPEILSTLSVSPSYNRLDQYPILLEKADFRNRNGRNVNKFVSLITYDKSMLKGVGKIKVRTSDPRFEEYVYRRTIASNSFRYTPSDLTDKSRDKHFKCLSSVEGQDGTTGYVLDFDNPNILNVGLYGANAVGTLTALAPWNNCTQKFFYKESVGYKGSIIAASEIKTDHSETINVPVPALNKTRENVLKTADSVRFVFAHNPFFNHFYTEDSKELVEDLKYLEDGRHINGCSYWYKDKDGLPSIVRPMHFNSLISVLSKFGYNFKAKLPYIEASAGTGKFEEDLDFRHFKNDIVPNNANERAKKEDLYIENHILEELNESLKDKIVVTDFKRINLSLNELFFNSFNCPILDSYLENGYTILADGEDINEDVYKSMFQDLVYRVRTDPVSAYGQHMTEGRMTGSVINRATGKMYDRRENGTFPNAKEFMESIYKQKAYGIMSNLKVSDGGFTNQYDGFYNVRYDQSPYYHEHGFQCSDIVVNENPTLNPCPPDDTEDFIETDGGYTICKYEVLMRHQSSSGKIMLGTSKSLSICLVKHTIIDVKDFNASSEDVLYDKNAEILIGKVHRDVETTKECIATYHHPLSKGYFDSQVGGYSLKYVRNIDDSNPKDIYVNVLGDVQHLVAEDITDGETAVEVYKEGKKIRSITKSEFEREGVFYNENLANSFSKYDNKLKYNHNLTELGKSELVSNDIRTKKEIAEQTAANDKAKFEMDMMKLEAEIEKLVMCKDLEVEKFKGTVAKYKYDLEKIALSIEELEKTKMQLLVKLEADIKSQNGPQPLPAQFMELANLVGKSAAAGTAVMNLYKVVKATL